MYDVKEKTRNCKSGINKEQGVTGTDDMSQVVVPDYHVGPRVHDACDMNTDVELSVRLTLLGSPVLEGGDTLLRRV